MPTSNWFGAGTFKTIDEAQDRICSSFTVYELGNAAQSVYEDLYQHYRRFYFLFGEPGKSEFGQVLPALIQAAKISPSMGSLMPLVLGAAGKKRATIASFPQGPLRDPEPDV